MKEIRTCAECVDYHTDGLKIKPESGNTALDGIFYFCRTQSQLQESPVYVSEKSTACQQFKEK